jgi:hypothetical protein
MNNNNQNINHDDNVEVEPAPKKTGIRKVHDLSTLNLRRNRKAKKTPSLFDTPLSDRNYWTEDSGVKIAMALTRVAISKSLSNGEMLDIKNYPQAARLSKEFVQELMEEQLHRMTLIADEDSANIFANVNRDGFVMVEFDNETNRYNFIEVK